MSMAINIRDLQLNERIEALSKRQPTPLERAVMARSILDAACAACEQTGNPLAWMNRASTPAASSPTSDGATEHGASASIRANTPSPSHPCDSSSTADTVAANAA